MDATLDPGGTVFLPRFSRRIRALWVDAAVLIGLILLWIVSLEWQLALPPAARAALLVVPIVFLEPAMVAWTGGTLGHHALGLRVIDARDGTRLGLVRACVRALLKAALGWLSLAFALFSARRQALHDAWTKSWVVVASADRVPPHDRFPAGEIDASPAVIGVSATRRLVAIVAWWLAATLAFSLVLVAIMLPLCDEQARCAAGPSVLVAAANLFWGVAMASIPALGWFGRLPGARARTNG